MKVQQRNVIRAITGKQCLQPGSPVLPTCCNLDIYPDSWPLPIAQSCETKRHGTRQQSEREVHQTEKQTCPLCSRYCACYPHFERSTNRDLDYHVYVRAMKFICTCLSKILDVFANKIVKREQRNAYVYLKEDILLILRESACEKGIYIWKQIISKLKQASVYKWQCEYPSSPNFAMTLMTLIFLLSDRSNLD